MTQPTERPVQNAALGRRDFLKSVALAGAAIGFPTIVPSRVFGQNAPSKRINMALIGLGGMMGGHASWALGNPGVQVLAVCDVDRVVREKYKAQVDSRYAEATRSGSYKGCESYNEFERIMERSDIDAVFVVTPDHWHVPISLAAVRSGKDVYVEKPMLLTVREGRMLANAVAETDAVLQVGSQQRSSSEFRQACEIVRNGWIGKVHEVQINLGEFAPPDLLPEQPIREGLDYDRWLGPTPWQPFNELRVERNMGGGWRRFWEYGSRKHGDWGAHHFDIAQWAFGKDNTGPVEFIPRSADGTTPQRHIYADGTVVTRVEKTFPGRTGASYAMRFIGESGEVLVTRGSIETTPAALIRRPLRTGDIRLQRSEGHHENWFNCIHSRQKPICHVEIGHRSASICALGAIAERLGRSFKWDPVTEEIIGDNEASRMLDRPRRAPYTL